MQEEKSIGFKFIILVLSVVAGALLGNGIMLLALQLSGSASLSENTLSELLSDSSNSILIVSLVGLSHALLFIGGATCYWWFTRRSSYATDFSIKRKIDWSLLGILLLLLVASYPLVGASGLVAEYLPLPEWMRSLDTEYAETMNSMFGGEGLARLALNIVVIALLPAIGEELIFRGVVQKELHKAISNPHLVIFITSVIFSAIHLQAEGFLPKLCISYVLCYAYYWTRNLLYPMILHFVNNASMTVALYASAGLPMEEVETSALDFPWLVVGFSLFLCGMIVVSITSRPNLPSKSAPNL